MTKIRFFLIGISCIAILFSWIAIQKPNQGLIKRTIHSEQTPMLFLAKEGVKEAPGVLIAHGFAASKQIMLGYAYTLAKAGYGVLLWDFQGHGANKKPFQRNRMQNDLQTALQTLKKQPEINSKQIALLGHSMGTRAILNAALNPHKSFDTVFNATVAISPLPFEENVKAISNLQLQAGEWEDFFLQNARKILQESGGENFSTQNARTLVSIDKAEHISILFRNDSHQAALSWFDNSFEQTNQSTYQDRRILWYILHIFSCLLLLYAIKPLLQKWKQSAPLKKSFQSSSKHWLSLFLAPILAAGSLFILHQFFAIQTLGGMLVGGALGIWLCIAGVSYFLMIWQFPSPDIPAISIGILIFLFLWFTFGAMGQVVWLQWWIVPNRLLLWPILSIACIPWFLSIGIVQQNKSVGKYILYWFAQTLAIIIGLILTIQLVPGLQFLGLLLPMIPMIFALISFSTFQIGHTWSHAIAGSLFFAWLIVAIFPLSI